MSTKRPSHLPPFRNPAAPSVAAAPAEALAWLIIWSDVNAITGDVVERQSVCRHNAVADYRAVDPDARVFPLYAAMHVPRADLSPIATRKLEELAGQGYVTNGVAIFNPATGRRGLVDNQGYVGWQGASSPEAPARLTDLTDQLQDRRNRLLNSYGNSAHEDAAIDQQIARIDAELAGLQQVEAPGVDHG